jgi:hypothetical protein
MISIKNCIDRNDLIPVISNVIFFVVVQTLFFKYVASKQYENVLESKLDFVKTICDNDPFLRDKIYKIRDDYLSTNKDLVENQQNKRDEKNKQLYYSYSGIPFFIFLLMLLHLLFMVKSKRDWNEVDTLSLLFVTLAYCTELFFFFFIVRKYEFVGDHQIISDIIDNSI